MGYLVRMPQMGMSMEEGTVVEWPLQEGEAVEEGSVVVVVESEKEANEVEAREDGVLRRILVDEGGVVEPGTPIGIVAGGDEDLSTYDEEVEGAGIDGAASDSGTVASDHESGADSDRSGDGTPSPTPSADVKATPGARRRAEEAGVDLSTVEGTGPQGVVTEDDVEAHSEAEDEIAADSEGAPGGATRTVTESRPLSGMQRTIAERLGESYREAVHVTLDRSFDAGPVRLVTTAARDAEVDGSLTDVLIAALADALDAHPSFNAVFEDGEHRLIEEVNVGVAVDLEDGLVTPVVPDVGTKSVEKIYAVRRELTERVAAGEFTMDDLAGGTITVSNLGPLGVDRFDPVINPPEVAILGVGRVREDGKMTLSLSFDHRVVNGADAARLLETLVETLTDAPALAGFFDAELDLGADDDAVEAAAEAVEWSGRPTEARTVRVETGEGYAGTYRTAYGDVAFDEPEGLGGDGAEPSPVDHLLGSLGSCLSLSVRAIADRDGVDVGSIACHVDGEPSDGPVSSIDIELRIETDAEDAVVDRLVATAERACYVSRALAEELDVAVGWERGS